jgi:hypothetical protein
MLDFLTPEFNFAIPIWIAIIMCVIVIIYSIIELYRFGWWGDN